MTRAEDIEDLAKQIYLALLVASGNFKDDELHKLAAFCRTAAKAFFDKPAV